MSELMPLSPEESPEFEKADLVHFQTGVGFDSPAQVWTAPGRETMPAACDPNESKNFPHFSGLSALSFQIPRGNLLRKILQRDARWRRALTPAVISHFFKTLPHQHAQGADGEEKHKEGTARPG